MAASKTISRSLKIYLDGKEVTQNMASIRRELRQARQDLNNAQVGSDKYREAMEKIGTLKGVLKEHQQQLRDVEQAGESLFGKAKKWITKAILLLKYYSLPNCSLHIRLVNYPNWSLLLLTKE